ncbi:hypothetical protein B0H21DRAFT_731686 [Amylocystis lapponica]|nr:hypothetical protein B0H21DRAFT_731686 [Amylocystis lapponica]
MQSAIPGLPPELCDLTIDFLQYDYRALKACSLASRLWLPRTRFFLFHVAIITTEQRYLEFESIIEASPEIAGFVRNLELDLSTIPTPSKEHWLHHELFRILKTLDKVEDLFILHWSAPELSEGMKQDLSTVFPMVTTLRFSKVDPPLKDDLVWILRACPRLHELEFHKCKRVEPVPSLLPRNILLSMTPCALVPGTTMTAINALKWTDSDFYILECLFQGPFTLNLQILDIGHGCPSIASTELRAISQRLIRGAGASLEQLAIDLLPHLPPLERYVDLSHNPNLVILALEDIRLSDEFYQGGWDVLLRALASVRSPHLEEINIDIYVEYESHEEDLDRLDWEQIDELLVLLARDRPRLVFYVCFDDLLPSGENRFTAEQRRKIADSIDTRLPHIGTDYPDRLLSSNRNRVTQAGTRPSDDKARY